jgi:hypothetical protein
MDDTLYQSFELREARENAILKRLTEIKNISPEKSKN